MGGVYIESSCTGVDTMVASMCVFNSEIVLFDFLVKFECGTLVECGEEVGGEGVVVFNRY